MEPKVDLEYSLSREDVGIAPEYTLPPEEKSSLYEAPKTETEFSFSPSKELPPTLEPKPAIKAEKKKEQSRLHRALLMQVAAVVVAVVGVSSAFGHDLLGEEFWEWEHEHWHEPDYYNEEPYDPYADETADNAFPRLQNLTPNGSVEGYGVLDEEYVMLEMTEEEKRYLKAGLKYGEEDENGVVTPAELYISESIFYEESTNTLILRGYTEGGMLNVNLMGNGFTVRLEGENDLDGILVWGFHYGGSITFTGSGTLTVNKNNQWSTGITLEAEGSESCIMVDSGIKLDVYGQEAAIMVLATKASKAIYYLQPLQMSGGVRTTGDPDEELFDFSIIDPDTGIRAAHVVFQ